MDAVADKTAGYFYPSTTVPLFISVFRVFNLCDARAKFQEYL